MAGLAFAPAVSEAASPAASETVFQKGRLSSTLKKKNTT